MENNSDMLRFEDYKKEFSKYELEKKHQLASNLISFAYRSQTLDAVMDAFEAVHDYLLSIPLEQLDSTGIGEIDKFLKRMDDISDSIWGSSKNDRVKALRERFKLVEREVKYSSVRIGKELGNFQYLLRELRDIHLKAGYFTTSSGLRLTIHKRRKMGWDKEMEEEGFGTPGDEDGV